MLSPGLLCTSSHNNTIKQDEGEGGVGGGGLRKPPFKYQYCTEQRCILIKTGVFETYYSEIPTQLGVEMRQAF